ncbi:hypothetical protein [Nocardiopsis sp. MG754419]|uniref:hypothetical protein n=1 Tax=Nocardiopsis sp. MG754419 TaxID=2259865 RepID=UPI001BA99D56|nr:hypothetical protein [Nocardiopsis sp. MG754419]MBR8744827.1 hypothetical protein [Nocardiopsis sp. MG754419]
MSNEPFHVLTPDALGGSGTAADPVVAAAIDAGHRPSTARVEALVEADRTVLVRCDPDPTGPDADRRGRDGDAGSPAAPLAGTVPADAATEVALAAVYAWAGARVFVTRHPERVRRALDMVASIRGERPPAAVRRGLV